MRFVRTGKKATTARQREAKRTAVLDRAVAAVRFAVRGPRLCLPTCVLLERFLKCVLPGSNFSLRLGSLQIVPNEEGLDPISFDPRGPDGIDGGFHAWLDDAHGTLLDPSVFVTLAAEGYDVAPDGYFLGSGNTFVREGLMFVYEELPELELLGLELSEPQLAQLMSCAMTGQPVGPGTVYLNVGWRSPADQG